MALDRVTRLCHHVLAELLFQELQVSETGDWGGAVPGWIGITPHDSVFGETEGWG